MILVKTEAGQQVFKERSVRFTPRQRSAFILFDGKRSVADVLGSGMNITQGDIDLMLELGLLGHVAGADHPAANSARVAPVDSTHLSVAPPAVASAPQFRAAAEPAAQSVPATDPRTAQQRYQDAYPIATKLTSGLGLRGFRLNLSVEGVSNYEQLAALLPKIRAAVGEEKAAPLVRALND